MFDLLNGECSHVFDPCSSSSLVIFMLASIRISYLIASIGLSFPLIRCRGSSQYCPCLSRSIILFTRLYYEATDAICGFEYLVNIDISVT